MSNNDSHLVFVYGSLKRGFGNHEWCLGDQEFLSRGRTFHPDYKMFSLGGFPGVHDVEGAGKINGELFRVDNEAFAKLDRLEGNGRMYQRHEVPIERPDGTVAVAWMYIYLGEEMQWCSRREGVRVRKNGVQDWTEVR